MADVARVPNIGTGADKAEVVAWRVDEGDSIEAGDLLVEVEGEKEIHEVEARESGLLRRRLRGHEATVEPGDPLGIVASAEADIGNLLADLAGVTERATDEADAGGDALPAGVRITPRAQRLAHEHDVDPEDVATAEGTAVVRADDVEMFADSETSPDRVQASPRARRLAAQRGVDLRALAAELGPTAIRVDEVRAAIEDDGADVGSTSETRQTGRHAVDRATTAARRTLVEERPLDGLRQSISERLSKSYREAVHVTVEREIVVDAFLRRVEELDEANSADVSFIDLLLVAVSETLDEHPEFNATFENDSHRIYAEHNVCVAVDTDRGLLAPVVPDVGKRQVGDVTRARRTATERVREGGHDAGDLDGGTFTVSNLGPFGTSSFDPVINPPQVAILGVNAIERAVVPVDNGLLAKEQVTVGLSFDHRVVDGADAARFLQTLATVMEAPADLK